MGFGGESLSRNSNSRVIAVRCYVLDWKTDKGLGEWAFLLNSIINRQMLATWLVSLIALLCVPAVQVATRSSKPNRTRVYQKGKKSASCYTGVSGVRNACYTMTWLAKVSIASAS